MRHRNTVKKLNKSKSERKGLIRNLLKSLIEHDSITTTEARYKVLRGHFDRLIKTSRTSGEENTTLRRVYDVLRDEKLARKLINDISKKDEGRTSGFLRCFKLDNRQGDNAKMVKVEIVK